LYVEPVERVDESVSSRLRDEEELGMTEFAYYEDFAQRIEGIKTSLINILDDIKSEGKRIVGYGAAAKATTLMAYCGVDGSYLDYVVDLNRFKHGRYMGGNHLEIRPTETLVEDNPDYVLVLAWNFADEIMKQQAQYESKGGRFIVPIPSPKIV
jgi:hypothetical protein